MNKCFRCDNIKLIIVYKKITITINANPTTYEKCFYQYYEANGTIKIIGNCSQQTKENLASTNNQNNITY